MAGALERVGDRAGRAHQRDGVGEVVVGDAVPRHGGFPEGAVVLAAARMGEDQGQGHLALAEIIAEDLAHGRFVRGVVDRVVDQLEGDAEVAAIGVERVLGTLASLGDDRGDAAGGGEQRGGLGHDDREILVLVRVEAALGGELVDLAFGDHRRGVAENFQHLEAAVLDHQFECARKEEIADEDARRVAPDEVGGALAAAHRAQVDDIVVEQGRGVDELDRGGELVVARAGIVEQRGAGERQHRPHPLAAAGDEVAGKLRDQRDLRLHAREDDGVDRVHRFGGEREQRVERGRPRVGKRVDRGGHGSPVGSMRSLSNPPLVERAIVSGAVGP